jgi:hypothetical protein
VPASIGACTAVQSLLQPSAAEGAGCIACGAAARGGAAAMLTGGAGLLQATTTGSTNSKPRCFICAHHTMFPVKARTHCQPNTEHAGIENVLSLEGRYGLLMGSPVKIQSLYPSSLKLTPERLA